MLKYEFCFHAIFLSLHIQQDIFLNHFFVIKEKIARREKRKCTYVTINIDQMTQENFDLNDMIWSYRDIV